MSKIKIKSLKLLNFKGIPSFEIANFNNGISIYGDNATGKTTVFDAFSWLLFGKDSLNSAVFEIKTLTKNGAVVHGLEYSVEAVLDTGQSEITLKKTYLEKYTKRRGEAQKTFTGHTVDHQVNGVPCKQKEFGFAVDAICNEENFKLLTNPRYFNEVLHWTKRRALLLQVCGDIPDADVIATNSALDTLPNILGDHKIDDQKKIIAARRAKINKELEKIPVRINEANESKIEVADSLKEINEKLKLYTIRKEKAEKVIANTNSGGGIAEKEIELYEKQAEILAYKNAMEVQKNDRLASQRKERARFEDASIEAARATEQIVIRQTDKIKRKKELSEDVAELELTQKQLRRSWFKINEKEFTPLPPGSNTCPACGQKLPADKIEEASRLALEAFNQSKAKDLTAISEKGKKTTLKLNTLIKDITAINEMIVAMDVEIKKRAEIQDVAEAQEDDCKARHEKANITLPPDLILDDLISQEDVIGLDINGLRAGTYETLLAAEGDLDRIKTMISLFERNQLQIEANLRIDKRIIKHKENERALAAEYEKLESELFIIETFIRTKVDMLEIKINQKFLHASFRLFVENINGGLEECCDTTFEGVPYNSMNNGARINIGLDICNTLSEYYGISLPCFIDNSEAVTRLFETEAQQIRLFVSKSDKSLRVEND